MILKQRVYPVILIKYKKINTERRYYALRLL